MEKNELKNVLSALEADNAVELNSRTGEHRFPKSHFGLPRNCRRLPFTSPPPSYAALGSRPHCGAFVRTCDRMRRCGIQILYQIYTQLRHCRYVQ